MRIWETLRHRDFRLLWLGQTVSGFGNRIYAIALPFLVLSLGGSSLELGLTATILSVSSLVFLLVGGAVADRVPRRRLILVTDLTAGCAVGVTALLSWAGLLRVEHIYVATAVLGVTSSFFEPAYNAIIPELVPADVLQSGNALRSLSKSLSRTLGPALGGVIIALGGPALGLAVDAATFFFSFAVLLVVRTAIPTVLAPRPSVLAEVREGLSFVMGVPWLWKVALGYALLNITSSAQLPVALPLFVNDVLRGGAADLGLINSAYGVGSILGGIALGAVTIRRPGLAIYAFEALSGLALMLIGLVPLLPAVALFMALSAATLTGSDIVYLSAVQRHVPTKMLGRVSSVSSLATSVLNPVGPLFAVFLLTSFGAAGAFVVMGFMALAIAIALLVSPLRLLDSVASAGQRAAPG